MLTAAENIARDNAALSLPFPFISKKWEGKAMSGAAGR